MQHSWQGGEASGAHGPEGEETVLYEVTPAGRGLPSNTHTHSRFISNDKNLETPRMSTERTEKLTVGHLYHGMQ